MLASLPFWADCTDDDDDGLVVWDLLDVYASRSLTMSTFYDG